MVSACLSAMASAQSEINQPDVAPCPADFFSVTIPEQARQCQMFDVDVPASMVFYTPQDKSTVMAYYQSTLPALQVRSTFNERTLMAIGNQLRIVVSPDGNGSQVDILVMDDFHADVSFETPSHTTGDHLVIDKSDESSVEPAVDETAAIEEPVVEATTAEETLPELTATHPELFDEAEPAVEETAAIEEPVVEATTAEETLPELTETHPELFEAEPAVEETAAIEEPVVEATTAEETLPELTETHPELFEAEQANLDTANELATEADSTEQETASSGFNRDDYPYIQTEESDWLEGENAGTFIAEETADEASTSNDHTNAAESIAAEYDDRENALAEALNSAPSAE
ncbi:hypothetical protein DXV75_00510 [Alteromonas aestuariivivens]|uniref:Uncharacterized protein n=2 Tax=Alteromonas aestuariivivens TaxID=1938339 RepID=A0A3D8MEP6_9ALTE|nr:hypothetical protein DXV75_00510 [Alteromonas aestuariivivens]